MFEFGWQSSKHVTYKSHNFWVILCLFEVKPDTMRLRCRAQLLLLSACQLQLLFIRIANRFGILAYMLFSSQNYSLNYLGKRPHSADSFDSSDPALYNTNFRSHFANIRNWFLDFFFNAEHVIPDLKWDFWNSYIQHLIQYFLHWSLSLWVSLVFLFHTSLCSSYPTFLSCKMHV